MASVFQRRRKWWCRLKQDGKWISKPTPYSLDDGQDLALRYALAAQAQLDARSAGAITVATYAERWIKARRERGVASVADDDGRLANHVLPVLGPMALRDVKPRHIRDLVRALTTAGKLAPRTVINVYAVMSAMFREAVTDELIAASPCVLKRGDLPAKADGDSEWRALATYTEAEVRELITSRLIPRERRVQYALKALAGLRHGEVAGLRWRHLIAMDPLAQLVVATSYNTGRTKTKVTRLVPVHPALARVLEQWRACWAETYDRDPGADDLIVPTRNWTPVDPTDANRALKGDLAELGLRLEAGRKRDRGGHDLRAWFLTTAQEHGARREILRVVTHRAPSDVIGGYTRITWPALCAEVALLRVDLGDDPLAACDPFATRRVGPRGRWRKAATPTGFENSSEAALDHQRASKIAGLWVAGDVDVRERVARLATRAVEVALGGDRVGAERVLREIRAALCVENISACA